MKVEIGNIYYNKKMKYHFVIVGRTIRRSIENCMWYAIRSTGQSISVIWQYQIDKSEYIGKSKGLKDLFMKDEEGDK